MPHIGYENREFVFKIVYYGPGMSGKTTNLVRIHKTLPEHLRGEMIILDTAEERTLFFDFFPVELGQISGYTVRLNLYTVPGQFFYEASRRLILYGADGVVFVADSQPFRYEANLVSFQSLTENLESYGITLQGFPLVLQYNKRDLTEAVPLGTLEKELGLSGIPMVEAVAIEGRGVMETVRAISRRVIEDFRI